MASPVSLSSVNTLSSISRHLVDTTPARQKADRKMLDLIEKTEQGKSHFYNNLINKMVNLYPKCSTEVQKILEEKYDRLCADNEVNTWSARRGDKFKIIEKVIDKRKPKNSEQESEHNGAKAQQSNEPKNIVSDGQKLMSAYAIVSQQPEKAPEPGQNGPDLQEDQSWKNREDMQEGFARTRSGTGTGMQIGEETTPEQGQMIVEMDKAQPAPEYQEGEGGRPRSKTVEFSEFLRNSEVGGKFVMDDIVEEMESKTETDGRNPQGEPTQNEPSLANRVVSDLNRSEGTPFGDEEGDDDEDVEGDVMTISDLQDYNPGVVIENYDDDGDDDSDEGEMTIGLERDEEIDPPRVRQQDTQTASGPISFSDQMKEFTSDQDKLMELNIEEMNV